MGNETRIWLLKRDLILLPDGIRDLTMDYDERKAEGILPSEGFLKRISKDFVLGQALIWNPHEHPYGYPVVMIEPGSSKAYPSGAIMTPYSRADVIFDFRLFDQKAKPLDETTDMERIELLAGDLDSLVDRAFATYYGPTVARYDGKGDNFLLHTIGRDVDAGKRYY